MSRQFPALVFEHVYAEQGMGYCGFKRFEDGELVEGDSGNLIYSKEEDDEWESVSGPDYVLILPHFGG